MISRRQRWINVFRALILLAIFPVSWLAYSPLRHEALPPFCLFLRLTSRPCPFCGLTRAFAHATHGELREAWEFHALWWLAALTILAVAAALLIDAFAGTGLTGYLQRLWRRASWPLVTMLVVLSLLRIFCIRVIGG